MTVPMDPMATPPAEVTTGMLWVLLAGLREDVALLRLDLANNVVRKDVYEAEKVAGAQQFELEKAALKSEVQRLRSVFHWLGGLTGSGGLAALSAWLYNAFSAHPHA